MTNTIQTVAGRKLGREILAQSREEQARRLMEAIVLEEQERARVLAAAAPHVAALRAEIRAQHERAAAAGDQFAILALALMA